jgi:hypothetical protein
VIACEIAAGRLEPCRDKNWQNVRWVPGKDMTIDTPRVARGQIDLVRENMADNMDFTLRTTGLTPQQLTEQRAAEVAHAKATAARYGLTYAELCPGVPGTQVAATDTATDEPPKPAPDSDPESV